jgi:hypothetical protein
MSIVEYTESHGAAILDHLLSDVAGLPADSPIRLALTEDGISTVVCLLSLTEGDIDTLQYTDGTLKKSLHRKVPRVKSKIDQI